MPFDVVVTSSGDIGAQSSEEVVGQIDGLALAGAALVDEFAGGALAIQGDRGHAAAVRVAVGLSAHHFWKEWLAGVYQNNGSQGVN